MAPGVKYVQVLYDVVSFGFRQTAEQTQAPKKIVRLGQWKTNIANSFFLLCNQRLLKCFKICVMTENIKEVFKSSSFIGGSHQEQSQEQSLRTSN